MAKKPTTPKADPKADEKALKADDVVTVVPPNHDPKPKDEPDPAVHPTEKVNQQVVARVLRRSGLRPVMFDLAAIVEDVNVHNSTIQDAAARHHKKHPKGD